MGRTRRANVGHGLSGRWALLLLCGFASGRVSLAQDANASGEAPVRVYGVVLNAVTQSPIPRALVTNADRHMAMMTDDKGRFEFEVRTSANFAASVPPTPSAPDGPDGPPGGNAFLMVMKPGYRSAAPTPVPVGDANALKTELRLQLMPEATVAGSVRVPGGEFPPGLTLRLLRRQVQDGRATWMESQSQTVDARGRYRFGGLAPGEYKVVTQEWTDRVGPLVMTGGRQMMGYPAQAYPNGASPAAAGVIRLDGGRSIGADMDLRAARYYPVEIPVVGNVPVGLAAALATSDNGTSYSLSFDEKTHGVQGALPDGLYHLSFIAGSVRPEPGKTANLLTGVAELSVAGKPVHGPPVAVLPGTSIPVIVREEYNGPDPNDQAAASGTAVAPEGQAADLLQEPRPEAPQGRETERSAPRPVEVYLFPEGLLAEGMDPGIFGTFSLRANYSEDGGMAFESVPPGRYRVGTSARLGYVASLTANGLNLIREPLVIDPGAARPAIAVVLRDDVGTITATLSEAARGQGVLSLLTSVWAYPLGDEGPSTAVGGLRQPDGSFMISGVVPGRYLVLAVKGQGLNLEYRNSDAMKPYESKGVVVEILAGQKLSVSLKEAIAITDWDDSLEETVD